MASSWYKGPAIRLKSGTGREPHCRGINCTNQGGQLKLSIFFSFFFFVLGLGEGNHDRFPLYPSMGAKQGILRVEL